MRKILNTKNCYYSVRGMIAIPKNSLDLFQRRDEIRGEHGDDTFFLTCRYEFHERARRAYIWIDETCPAVVNDNKQARKAPDMMSMTQARSESLLKQEISLLAGGAFVWIGDKIALLERDGGTKTMPWHWTNPSGMAGIENPFQTPDKELGEELALCDRGKNEIFRFGPAHTSFDDQYVRKNLAALGVKASASAIQTRIWTDNADFVRDASNEVLVKLFVGRSKEDWLDTDVRNFSDVSFDPKTNTFVLNEVFRYNADPARFDVVDAEPFGRRGGLFTLDEALAIEKMVPTTRTYLKSCRR